MPSELEQAQQNVEKAGELIDAADELDRRADEIEAKLEKTAIKDIEIVAIIDRSGSMANLAQEASNSFNDFIRKQRELPGKAWLTLAQFDDEYELVYGHIPLSDVPEYIIKPRNMTALLDAIGKTINHVKESPKDRKILVLIVTDGMENASREFTREQINTLISEQTKAGWEFIFLAANQDAIVAGQGLGIMQTNSMRVGSTATGYGNAYAALGSNIRAFRAPGGQSCSLSFSADQRATQEEEVKKEAKPLEDE